MTNLLRKQNKKMKGENYLKYFAFKESWLTNKSFY